MPSSSQNSSVSGYPSTARPRPRRPNKVLAEAEQQWIFSEDELRQTPSILDGMSIEEERERRFKGINFILQVGVMLKLPQVTISTAAVYFNRFMMRVSLVSKPGGKALHHYQVAGVSLFLATKVEETCRKTKELVVACCRVAQKNPNLLVDEQTRDFWRWRDTILFNEDLLLETICFDLTVEAPHRTLFEMLKYYNVEHNKRLRNAAWGFLNDSNLTQLCVLFTSRTIAAAALYCGAKLCEVGFPDEEGKPWWEVQYVSIKDIRRACNYMAGIYENVPPKDGAESIYVGLRTPEDADDRDAHTRLRTSQTPQSPSLVDAVSMERTASSQSLKRSREDEGTSRTEGANGASQSFQDDSLTNGNGTSVDERDMDRQSKRPKLEANGDSHESKAAIKEEEEGSEEGELEE